MGRKRICSGAKCSNSTACTGGGGGSGAAAAASARMSMLPPAANAPSPALAAAALWAWRAELCCASASQSSTQRLAYETCAGATMAMFAGIKSIGRRTWLRGCADEAPPLSPPSSSSPPPPAVALQCAAARKKARTRARQVAPDWQASSGSTTNGGPGTRWPTAEPTAPAGPAVAPGEPSSGPAARLDAPPPPKKPLRGVTGDKPSRASIAAADGA